MDAQCQIPNAIEKIFAGSHCGVAYIGGSLTVGVGASSTAETSFRALFTRYLYEHYHARYHCQPSEIMGAVGACESYVASFTLVRNVLPAKPELALVEFCVNDRGAPDEDLVLKGLEGIVRQLLFNKTRCEVMILGAGVREGSVDHALHRRVADHYGLPFVDLQGYLHAQLAARGQTWDDAAIDFVEKDSCHLNDYGNRLCFEAIQACFEEQVGLFREGRRRDRDAPIPPPLQSDELQYVELVDPSRRSAAIELRGEWTPKPEGQIPWYFDHVLAGKPNARLTFTFTGTAVAVFGLMYHNGLKLEATLDGAPIKGAYLKHQIEFGKGVALAHGLPDTEHVLTLTVAPPSKRHNKQADPTAGIGYLGVAHRPAAG